MSRLAKFWSLTRSEKEFLCEASLLLSISNICVKAIAFRRIDRFLRTRWNEIIQGCIDREQEIGLVQRSISRAANVLPWESLCLSRSIAEFVMLRRRGIPAVMFAGVRFSGHSSLDAHAWVDIGLGLNDKRSENSGFATVIRIGTGAIDR
jgi:transglutaminase superfamily protein